MELVEDDTGCEDVALELVVLEELLVFCFSLAPQMLGELTAAPRELFR